MVYIYIEIVIFFCWSFLFVTRCIKKSKSGFEERIVFLSAIISTLIMELINEFAYKGKGMYYPESILYFPGFNFTVAIVLLGSIYSWTIYVITKVIADNVSFGSNRHIIQIIFIMIGINSWYLVEWFGLTTGYWAKAGGEIHYSLRLILYSYLYYWLFSFPPMILAILLRNNCFIKKPSYE